MKLKKIIPLVLLVVIGSIMAVRHNMYIIKYGGIKLEMPFAVNENINQDRLIATGNNTLLTIHHKDIDFNQYKSKILEKSKSEMIINSSIIDLKDKGKIFLVTTKLVDSGQVLILYGYIESKQLFFTFSGNTDSINGFETALRSVSFYN